MREIETIVVGGGPAGSAAAARLTAAGRQVVVLDREVFPRPKLCAGWITPEVLRDLSLNEAGYPHGFLSFRRLHWHVRGMHLPVPCIQHSIRRLEFDAWLLQRSGAEVVTHPVRQIVRDQDQFLIDGAFRCRYLIGAGGTSCPVRRILFEETAPRLRELQTVTLELEFPHPYRDPDCHLWFFERGLPGYSWYVPKAAGWLNVGVGAMASRLKERGETVREHWRHLTRTLQRRFDIVLPAEPSGYSYYLKGVPPPRLGNAFIAGDAAGLATRDLCEGIGPAIRSGQLAADCIVNKGTTYQLGSVTGASLGGGWLSRWMDRAFTRGAGRRV